MLHLEIIYQPGFGRSSMDINYHLFTEPFGEIIQKTLKNLNDMAIPCESVISTLLGELNGLNESMAELPSLTPINQTVLDALQQLQTSTQDRRFVIQNIAKILMQCEFIGIKELKFTPLRGQTNPQKLDELNYPEKLIPEHYLCAIQSVIMTIPVEQTGAGLIDMAAVAIHTHRHGLNDMVTREPLPGSIEVNQDMLAKIELFIKKVQLTYYMFQHNDEYKNLYAQEMIQTGLKDEALSYEDFRQQLMSIPSARMGATQSLSFFSPSESKPVYPPMDICRLFTEYKVRVLQPSKNDYELLIRRIAAKGSASDLHTLLTSPVLDALAVNVDSQSTNGLSALDWINQQAEKFPQKASEFEACRNILSRYKESHIDSATFGI